MATIPSELWMSVFEELDSSRDLANVVRTSRRFKSLGIRVLYRHVIWTDPLKFVRCHPFVQHNPHLRSVVRALTLGISSTAAHLDRIEQLSRARAVVHLSGEIAPIYRPTRSHEVRILDETGIVSPVDLVASDHVTDAIYSHAVSFTNLRDLTFTTMVLPDNFYDCVHRFPALDKLAIENCTPPLRPHATRRHPRDLPITELAVIGLRGRRNPPELHAFAEGHQLRVIRFDWTCYVFKHFCDIPPIPPHNNWPPGFAVLPAFAVAALHPVQIPQLLIPYHQDPVPSPHIHTIDIRFPTQKSWQSYVAEPHDQLVNPFTEFLVKCPRITHLRIRNHLPWIRLPDSALPNLAYFQGPLTTIKSVVSGPRRIKHLAIRDPTGGLAAVEKAFKEIEASGGGVDLETLSLVIGWWDDEILYAVLHHFNGLKQLEIMYKEGDPTEEMVLSMGAHFFGLMPRLWAVRVFKVASPGVENVCASADILGARGYPRLTQPFLTEVISADSPERAELDDAEFEEAKLASSSRVGWTADPEDPEEVVLKELIQAWNRYCPVLREVQLKAGYVWRRVDADDVWTQRATKMSRVQGE